MGLKRNGNPGDEMMNETDRQNHSERAPIDQQKKKRARQERGQSWGNATFQHPQEGLRQNTHHYLKRHREVL